jgi:hypothetical protein
MRIERSTPSLGITDTLMRFCGLIKAFAALNVSVFSDLMNHAACIREEQHQRQVKLKRQNSHWRLSSSAYLWRLLDNGELGPLWIAQLSKTPERAICRGQQHFPTKLDGA